MAKKLTITNANISELDKPVKITEINVRVYSMISGNNLPACNEIRQANKLKPLVPNTKQDSANSKADKAYHFFMDLDMSKKNVNGSVLGDLVTQTIDPAILIDWVKGVAYDNSYKSAVQKAFENGTPDQAEINKIAQVELEREKVRESTGATATFSSKIIELVKSLNPTMLRKKQTKVDGEMVDTDEYTLDGKKITLGDITKLNKFPNMQLGQVAYLCFNKDADKYRKWKAAQGTKFSKDLDNEKKEKAKQDEVL